MIQVTVLEDVFALTSPSHRLLIPGPEVTWTKGSFFPGTSIKRNVDYSGPLQQKGVRVAFQSDGKVVGFHLTTDRNEELAAALKAIGAKEESDAT